MSTEVDMSAVFRFLLAFVYAFQARQQKIAAKAKSKIQKQLSRGEGVPLVEKLVLGAGFLAVTALADYALWERVLGWAPPWIWTFSVGANALLLWLCHSTLPKTMFDINKTPPHMRRKNPAFWGELLAVAVIVLMVVGYSIMASVIRGRAMHEDAQAIFGTSGAPALWITVVLFVALHLAGFAGGALIGWQHVKRSRGGRSEDLPTPTRAKRRVVAIAAGAIHDIRADRDRTNERILREAARYEDEAPARLPTAREDPDIIAFFEELIERYGCDADAE